MRVRLDHIAHRNFIKNVVELKTKPHVFARDYTRLHIYDGEGLGWVDGWSNFGICNVLLWYEHTLKHFSEAKYLIMKAELFLFVKQNMSTELLL